MILGTPGCVKKILRQNERVLKAVAANMGDTEHCLLVLTSNRIIITTDNFWGRGAILYVLEYLEIRDINFDNIENILCSLTITTDTEKIDLGITQSSINEFQKIINNGSGDKFKFEPVPVNRRLVSNKWSTLTLIIVLLLSMPFITSKFQSWGQAHFKQNAPVLSASERRETYREWGVKIQDYWNNRADEPSIIENIDVVEKEAEVIINVNMNNFDAENAGDFADFIGGNFRLNFSDQRATLNIYNPYPHLVLVRKFNATSSGQD